MSIRVIRVWQAIPGSEAKLREALVDLMRKIEAKPGVMEACLFEDRAVLGSFAGIGVFESEEALLYSGPQAYLTGLSGVDAAYATAPSTLYRLKMLKEFRHPKGKSQRAQMTQFRIVPEQIEIFPVTFQDYLQEFAEAWDVSGLAFGQVHHIPTMFFFISEWGRNEEYQRYLASDFRHVRGRSRYGQMLEEEPRRFELYPLWEYRRS